MKKRFFTALGAFLLFGGITSVAPSSYSDLSTRDKNHKDILYLDICDIDSNVSTGDCWCDSIRLYHAYLHTFDHLPDVREIAIEAAVGWFEECQELDN
ncbi:hypothetical protein [Winogradskyella sp.]|uniref:hypothetical protein n=1 Tax=Winogradskyella sp. TaxID=1883156 RepID=UPI0025E0B4E3|nr:hypothetical protein [Winogradskyella sp.]MBT8244408.1 hypothetical protein [Winogradskyella sp.]